MKMFVLWVMLARGEGITLESHEYHSMDTCTAAEAVIHKQMAVEGDFTTYAIVAMTSCTEK